MGRGIQPYFHYPLSEPYLLYPSLIMTSRGYPLPPGVMVTYPGEVDAVHKISGKIHEKWGYCTNIPTN